MVEEEEKRKAVETAKRLVFMRLLDEGARRRLYNIKFANPDFGEQLEQLIIEIFQTGKIEKLTESDLIKLINQIKGPKRETKIIRK